jgi:hypothetical protein
MGYAATSHNRSVYAWQLLARQFKSLRRLGLRNGSVICNRVGYPPALAMSPVPDKTDPGVYPGNNRLYPGRKRFILDQATPSSQPPDHGVKPEDQALPTPCKPRAIFE